MDDAISPYAIENSAGASRTRWSRGNLRATAGAYSAARTEHVQPPCARSDEEDAEQIADSAAGDRRLDDERDADPDEDEGQGDDRRPVRPHAARRSAATITRQGACLRTKSTVSLKTACRGRSRRGVPITMISVCRRSASSTIARPALRARTRRSVTSTP